MPRPDGSGQQFLGHLGGLVLVHEDFLADDSPLPLDLRGGQAGMRVDVPEHVADLPQPAGLGLGVIAGVVLGRECLQVAAQPLDLAADPPGRAPRGALEEEVFEKMRRAVEPGALVPAADRRPQAHAHAGHVGHLGGGNPQAVGQGRQVVGGRAGDSGCRLPVAGGRG